MYACTKQKLSTPFLSPFHFYSSYILSLFLFFVFYYEEYVALYVTVHVRGKREEDSNVDTHRQARLYLNMVVKTKAYRQAARQSRSGNGHKQNAKQITGRLLSPQHRQCRGQQ